MRQLSEQISHLVDQSSAKKRRKLDKGKGTHAFKVVSPFFILTSLKQISITSIDSTIPSFIHHPS